MAMEPLHQSCPPRSISRSIPLAFRWRPADYSHKVILDSRHMPGTWDPCSGKKYRSCILYENWASAIILLQSPGLGPMSRGRLRVLKLNGWI